MKMIHTPIHLKELTIMAKNRFGDLVKAVVDVEQEVIALDGELHADEEAMLLSKGSKQEHLWGINLYPELSGEEFIEFDSMINVRPSVKNLSRNIEIPTIRKKIISIVHKLIQP